MEKYNSTFYKKLPLKVRQSIYESATTLAAGFLAFDSTNVSGTGGGPAALVGRVGALELAKGWLLKIATDMALEVLLTTVEESDSNSSTEEIGKDKILDTENNENTDASSQIQQIQIVNKDKTVADLLAKLDEIIATLK